MASLNPAVSLSQSLLLNRLNSMAPIINTKYYYSSSNLKLKSSFISVDVGLMKTRATRKMKMYPDAAGDDSFGNEKRERYQTRSELPKGFVEELKFVAMKMHTRGQLAPHEGPVARWDPTVQGYLRFLVDTKLVYDTLDNIIAIAAFPCYAEFGNTGLERSEPLAKDLEWFKEQGYVIPKPSSPGVTYARYLEQFSENDPQAFICHFYNTYFAHTAGGRIFGKKVAEKILDNKELEFYKWDGDLSQLSQNVKEKLNKVTQSWSRKEKDHCLEETEKAFKHLGEILRLILS